MKSFQDEYLVQSRSQITSLDIVETLTALPESSWALLSAATLRSIGSLEVNFERVGSYTAIPFQTPVSQTIKSRGLLPIERYVYWGGESGHDTPDDYGSLSYAYFEQEVTSIQLEPREVPHPDGRMRRIKAGALVQSTAEGMSGRAGHLAAGGGPTVVTMQYQVSCTNRFEFHPDPDHAIYIAFATPQTWFTGGGVLGEYILSVRLYQSKRELFATRVADYGFPPGRIALLPLHNDIMETFYKKSVLDGDTIEVELYHSGYVSASSDTVLLSGLSGFSIIETELA